MSTRNGKGAKIAGGITLSMFIAGIGLYLMLSDRAVEKGEAKATVKMTVEAIEKRVDHLEEHAGETEKILDGESGLVASVAVIKSKIENIENQGKAIIRKLDELAKK